MPTRLTVTIAVTLAAALVPAAMAEPAAARDDVAFLLEKTQPPARFKDHRPKFSIQEKIIRFVDVDGPVDVSHWFILDHGKVIAFMPRDLFHAGCLYMLDFRPGQGYASIDEVPFPRERWHIDTTIGAQLRTNAWIPTKLNTDPSTYDWKVDGDKVVLTRRFKGQGEFNEWTHRTKQPYEIDTTNILTLSVHPQLGYVVDTAYDTWTDEPVNRFEYASAAMSGRHTTWAEDQTCYRMAISSGGKPDGFHGYATNMGCTKQHVDGGKCRDGGIVAFLNDKTGWSTAYTNETGATSTLVVCRPHTDHDFTIPLKGLARETKGNLKRYVVRHRMLALTPEMTKFVWDTMDLLHADERKIMIRVGRLDDFEDQPLKLDTRQRGHTITNGEVTSEEAFSGKNSLKFTGQFGLEEPTLAVRPGVTYRLECRMLYKPWSKEDIEQKNAALKADWEQRVERAKKDNEKRLASGKEARPLPTLRQIGEPGADMTCRYFRWHMDNEYFGDLMKKQPSRPGEWQHLVIEFKAPAWGPALDIRFHAEGCDAYVDDFRLAPVDESAPSAPR